MVSGAVAESPRFQIRKNSRADFAGSRAKRELFVRGFRELAREY